MRRCPFCFLLLDQPPGQRCCSFAHRCSVGRQTCCHRPFETRRSGGEGRPGRWGRSPFRFWPEEGSKAGEPTLVRPQFCGSRRCRAFVPRVRFVPLRLSRPAHRSGSFVFSGGLPLRSLGRRGPSEAYPPPTATVDEENKRRGCEQCGTMVSDQPQALRQTSQRETQCSCCRS